MAIRPINLFGLTEEDYDALERSEAKGPWTAGKPPHPSAFPEKVEPVKNLVEMENPRPKSPGRRQDQKRDQKLG